MNYLSCWRQEIPDLPEINFDLDSQHTFNEIKELKPLVFRKLLNCDEVFNEIVLTLFPNKTTLLLLQNYFENEEETIYKTLAEKLKIRLK